MRKIGICLNFDDEERLDKIDSFLRERGFTPKFMTLNTIDTDFISDCEVLFGFFPRKVFKTAEKLKWFQCSYAGVDKFSDESIYFSPDVVLTNSKGAYGLTISEHMICVTLMMMRNFKPYMDNQNERLWKPMGDIASIAGSTAAVIGLGDIGENYAKRLKAMGAYVKAVRNHKNILSPYADEIYGPDEIEKAIENADIVALSMPSTKNTEHTMTRERLSLMKEGSYFINVGRGTAVDQKALCDFLKSGHIRGAALDVFTHEPLKPEDDIWDVPNLIITPHISGNTTLPLTRENIMNIFMDNFDRYLKGEKLRNTVNKKQGY